MYGLLRTNEKARSSPPVSKQQEEPHIPIQHKANDVIQLLQRDLGNHYLQMTAREDPIGMSKTDQECSLGNCRNCILHGVQAKLVIGEPGDIYEQEADRVADIVMRMSKPTKLKERGESKVIRGPYGSIQGLENCIQSDYSSDQALPIYTRAFYEPRFGYDFGGVRTHTDVIANSFCRALNARAFTLGQDIFFRQGEYDPEGSDGKRLLAHELAHVVQQGKAKTNYDGGQNASLRGSIPIQMNTHAGKQVQRATIQDCSGVHKTAVQVAIAAVPQAIKRTISAILDPANSLARNALEKYFGISSLSGSYPATIGLRLATIASRVGGATIECENPGSFMYGFFCGKHLAYVRPIPAFFGLANIHLCQPWFHNLSAKQQIGTIVHECAHRYIGADDEAYYTLNGEETTETRNLSDEDRRDNADSYGCLVQTLG